MQKYWKAIKTYDSTGRNSTEFLWSIQYKCLNKYPDMKKQFKSYKASVVTVMCENCKFHVARNNVWV